MTNARWIALLQLGACTATPVSRATPPSPDPSLLEHDGRPVCEPLDFERAAEALRRVPPGIPPAENWSCGPPPPTRGAYECEGAPLEWFLLARVAARRGLTNVSNRWVREAVVAASEPNADHDPRDPPTERFTRTLRRAVARTLF